MTKLLFDGDVLVYSVGFACEKRSYQVLDKDTDITYEFDSIRKARAAAENPEDVEMVQDEMPESFALKGIENVIDAAMRKLGGDSYEIYLTSENPEHNFRTSWAKTLPYKGNRKGVKPVHYRYIREKLCTDFGARVVRGHEADDELGLNQTEDTVIVSVDKDLLMVPGKHYNLRNKEVTVASDPGELTLFQNGAGSKRLKGFGFKWFCAQMLMGDSIDNIQGVKGMGPVKIFKHLDRIEDPLDMWYEVCNIYNKKEMLHMLEENSELLWISRDNALRFKDYMENILCKN